MMMRCAKPILIAAFVIILAGLNSTPASAEVSFGFFYSNLSPHGSWLVSAEYGRCWQPSVYRSGWNPYYDGHWVYTDLGWTWVSDYSWGAVPYHYGTWVLDPEFGWIWVPGTIWAPAWVVFRTGPDYIGWAPVSPRFTLGLSFRSYEPEPDLFVFVGTRHFLSPRIRTAVVRDSRRGQIINNTRIVNNINIENNVVVNRGPDVRLVERASGRRVREQRIENVARAAPGGRVDRAQLRVDARGGRELRVAEPIRESPSNPAVRGGEGRRDRQRVTEPRRSSQTRREEKPSGPTARNREGRRDRHQAIEPETQRSPQIRPSGDQRRQTGRDTRRFEARPGRDRQTTMNAPRNRPDPQDSPRMVERPRRPPQDSERKRDRRNKPDQGEPHGNKPPSD